MIKHNIIWFDIPMDYLGDNMAIVQSFEHIDKVEAHILAYHGGNTSFFLPLCHQIDLVFFGIVDDLVQPNDVRVLQALEHFELRNDAVEGVLAFACPFLHQEGFVHFFDRILVIRFFVIA
jgi:hypothetical protein